MADSDITVQQRSTDFSGNCLWDSLPVAVCIDVLARLTHLELVPMSLACHRWRTVVQSSVTGLTPRSVLAMPFIHGCSSIKQLDLGHAVPATHSGPFVGFSNISTLTGLTQLSLSTSSTEVWQGKAARLSAEQLQHLTALRLLKVLTLGHQQLLSVPRALQPLSTLQHLTQLSLDTTGDPWRMPYSNWAAVADLTNLRMLDLSGCSQSWRDCGTSAAGVECTAIGRLCNASDLIVGCSSSSSSRIESNAAAAPNLVPAPLYLVTRLTQLQTLILAHWLIPPTRAGMQAISQLPDLKTLDLSYCMEGNSSRAVAPLLAPAAEEMAAAAAAAAAAEAVGRGEGSMLALMQGSFPEQQIRPALMPNTNDYQVDNTIAFFSSLQSLTCIGTALYYTSELWKELRGLTHLDLSTSERLRGEGMFQLQNLRTLALQGCHQLDYDALALVLTHCSSLTQLDLQGSTIILHSNGTTAMLLQQGRYRSPAAAAAATGRVVSGSSSASRSRSSRQDAVGIPNTDQDVLPSEAAEAAAVAANGLGVVVMSGCGLAFEGLAWHALPQNPDTPSYPGVLLYDLINRTQWGLNRLTVLEWSQCTHYLLEKILPNLVPRASKTLTVLNLSSSTLPRDPLECWQGLATATNLKTLDLSHVGFHRHGYANACGRNPTVALLAAVACLKGLEELKIAGLRCYFALFHVLAGLSGLRSLDLSGARDMTDAALWSLTHLTGLTKLDISSAAASHPHTWGLIFFHLAQLQHLNLSKAVNFTSKSVVGLTQLTGLTSLDIQGTKAGDNATVAQLVGLCNCKRVAMTLRPANASSNGNGSSLLSRRRSISAESVAHQAATASLDSDDIAAGDADLSVLGAEAANGFIDSSVPGSIVDGLSDDAVANSAYATEPSSPSSGESVMRQLVPCFRHRVTLQQHDNQPPSTESAAVGIESTVHAQQQTDIVDHDRHHHHGAGQQYSLPPGTSRSSSKAPEPVANSSKDEQLDLLQLQYGFVAKFGSCQSLRQLVLGAGPLVAQYCRTILPPWIDVR